MKFKFVSRGGKGIALARQLKREGCIVTPLIEAESGAVLKRGLDKENATPSDTIIIVDSDVKKLTPHAAAGYRVLFESPEGNDLEDDKYKGIELADAFGFVTVPLFTFSDIDRAEEFVKTSQRAYNILVPVDDRPQVYVYNMLDTLDFLDTLRYQGYTGSVTLQVQTKAYELRCGCILKDGKYVEGSAFEAVVDRFLLGHKKGYKAGITSVCARSILAQDWMKQIGVFLPRHSGVVTLTKYNRRNEVYVDGWATRLDIPVLSVLPNLFASHLTALFEVEQVTPRADYVFSSRVSILPRDIKGIPITEVRKDAWLCNCLQDGKCLRTSGTGREILWLTSTGSTPEEAAKRTYKYAYKMRMLGKHFRDDAHIPASKVFNV